MNQLTQAIDRFDAYFRSANGVPPNDRISVPTAEWVALRALLTEAQIPVAPARPAEGVPAQAAQPSDALIEAVDAWFAENTGLGGCSDKDVSELAEIFATHPTQQGMADDAEVPEAVLDAVAQALGDAYDCGRVWSAWSYGTMSSDDFTLVAEDANRVAEIARAALAAQAKQGGA